jgi:hypothetical protein
VTATRSRPSPRLALSAALALAGAGIVASLAVAEEPAPPPAPAPPPSDGTPPSIPVPDPPRDPVGRQTWRESTWPSPTAEDWKKPVLLEWQRTWDDAVAVAKEEGRPILVCINMDGEIASENYAGKRYRDPAIAALYEPYVCVIASVYRHTPRDHDDEGRRIECPRFHGVTCGEHIAIEPIVFEKFCDGRRIAPRHILVEVDGKETFDVFYRNDTASVFHDIREGIAKRPPLPPRPVRGDRPVLERVASRHAADRGAVEAAYAKGDAASRKALLEEAAKHADVAPLDLLRLAVFGYDPDASRAARAALAKVETPAATELVADALRVPMEEAERKALVETLARLGGSSPLARWLSVVHRDLGSASGTLDASKAADGGAVYAGPERLDWAALEARHGAAEVAAREREATPAERLEMAETALFLALDAPSRYAAEAWRARLTARHFFAEARRHAAEAERLGASGWRLEAVATLAPYYAGDVEAAYARAPAAAKAIPAGDGSWASMAVLTVFAEARWKGVKKAAKEKEDIPPGWLSDVHTAYTMLLRHPLGTEDQVLWHQDLLDWLGATDASMRVLRRGLDRFRDSAALHARLRDYVLKRKGPDAVEEEFARAAEASGAPAASRWHAALASLAAADAHRRATRYEEARASLGRAIEWYGRAGEAGIDPAAVAAAVAAARASRARVALQAGDLPSALEDVAASLAAAPGDAGTKDGLGIVPVETAQAVLARLREAGDEAGAARLDAAIRALDPAVLPSDGE